VTWLIHMCDMTHSYMTHTRVCTEYVHMSSWVCAHEFVSMCTWVREYVHMRTHEIQTIFMCATRFIHMCDMTHSYVWHDSITFVTWLIHTWHTHAHEHTVCVRVVHENPRVPTYFYMCDMTHSYVCHDSFFMCGLFTCVTWLIHIWHALAHAHAQYVYMWRELKSSELFSYVWHDSFICVTRLIHLCDMTRSHMCHDSCIRHTHTHTHAHTQYVYSWHMRTQKIRLLWALTSSFLHCRYVRTFNVRHDSFNVRHDSFNPRHDLSIFDIDFIPWIYTYAHIQIHFSTYLYIYIYIHVQVCRSIDTSIWFCHKVLCMCLCVYFRSINVRCGLSLRFVCGLFAVCPYGVATISNFD